MTIENQIKDEKLQYDIKREAAKISALSSGKIDRYEYLTGNKILRSNQQQIFRQTKFSDCNWIRTHNHLVHKRTQLNHLASLAKWLSVRL